MIFSSEQAQPGMNEGTWFTQGMCIKNEGIICREEEDEEVGGESIGKKEIPAGIYLQGFVMVIR